MSEHLEEPQNWPENVNSLRILQINLNKSERAHLDIINEKVSKNYDIILIQEPFSTVFNAIRTPTNFRPIFPIHRLQNQEPIRSVIWVNKKLSTGSWVALDVPGTNDITAMQLEGPYGKVSIFNVYNDCTHFRTEATLRRYIYEHADSILANEDHHMLLMGDFNRHHPLWDDDKDTHLFTRQASRAAEGLIGLIATYELAMALPKGIPTLQHMVTKRYSRPDNIFNMPGLSGLITKCAVDPSIRPTSTDHFPITTNITLSQERVEAQPSYNFREVDWDIFRQKLRTRLNATPNPRVINTQDQLHEAASQLTQAVQLTIGENVAKSRPRPDAKRWWNSDLKKMKKELNRLRAKSYTFRAIANHPSHEELRSKSNIYGEAIVAAKQQHWVNYLEEMTAADIWTANKFVKEPAGDGGCLRIPTLTTRNAEGGVIQVNSNEDKAKLFANTFSPSASTDS